MSRSNPYIKKRRFAKKTVLFYGEGFREEAFLKHLRGLYGFDSGFYIKIRKGRGGSADKIVSRAINAPENSDLVVVVLDCDKEQLEMNKARQLAKDHSIKLIENNPCIEGLFLEILREHKKHNSKTTLFCKKEFEKCYISKKGNDAKEYEKIFLIDILEKERKFLKNLNTIIDIIEGKIN